MRKYRKMYRKTRRNRRTKKGGDNKTHHENINGLISDYWTWLLLQSDKVSYSSDPENKKKLSEFEALIDIFENPKISRETKLKYVRAAQRASPKAQRERNALQQILNPLRNEHLQKREEQTRKNRENGQTNTANFTNNEWAKLEKMPVRARRN